MGKRTFKKPEATHIQGICVRCNVRKQTRAVKGKYRAICSSCARGLYTEKYSYREHKKKYCEECNFVAIHPCQLDVDHIDGNHSNNDPSNLKTLCANCHRLKTHKQLYT